MAQPVFLLGTMFSLEQDGFYETDLCTAALFASLDLEHEDCSL
jgi:hypothetical protein